MAKAPGDKTKEVTKPGAAAPAHAQTGGQASGPAPLSSKGKRPEPMAGMCCAVGCKASSKQFSFCGEHFEQFKFGLIKKTGEAVSDYEKKFEHYQAWVARLKAAHRVA